MRTISSSSSSPELNRILNEAAGRIVVLVEGKDDCIVLREWFKEERVEVEFFDCGGSTALTELLKEWLTSGTLKRAYGITDRDFRSDEVVENSYAENSHQFILRRYALENYLLETKTLWEVLKEGHPEIINELPTEQALATQLLKRCRTLQSIMAANWVFFEASQNVQDLDPEYFSVGHETNREIVIKRAAVRLNCSEIEAEERVTQKEQILESYLAQLETAHQIIDGKRLLHWIHIEQYKTGKEDFFRRRLMNEAKVHGLPADVVDIIREKIIRRSNNHSA